MVRLEAVSPMEVTLAHGEDLLEALTPAEDPLVAMDPLHASRQALIVHPSLDSPAAMEASSRMAVHPATDLLVQDHRVLIGSHPAECPTEANSPAMETRSEIRAALSPAMRPPSVEVAVHTESKERNLQLERDAGIFSIFFRSAVVYLNMINSCIIERH
ncbi:uncharacterized protein LOC122242802 [Penaeus japonicus]|uniref:uncharacterized protein LOC122242802 n=1 Tax=Penaeus japonicus TaxID=27405 RepID=UPI001C7151AC|nr:uncharacterized protein LOC122242802 [Penaeus japonicus]